MMTKMPREKRMQRRSFLVRGSLEVIRRGRGMQSIITSEEMLKTALVIRWWIAAEHCTAL
jgi:hypothetical protein